MIVALIVKSNPRVAERGGLFLTLSINVSIIFPEDETLHNSDSVLLSYTTRLIRLKFASRLKGLKRVIDSKNIRMLPL